MWGTMDDLKPEPFRRILAWLQHAGALGALANRHCGDAPWDDELYTDIPVR